MDMNASESILLDKRNRLCRLVRTQILAPTGAQGMLLSVCPSVCAAQTCLEPSIFIFLGQRALRGHSENTQRAQREQ